MTIVSMTGFARSEGIEQGAAIAVEARCVNGRSADIKLRLPAGFEALERPVRDLFQPVVRRGNAAITLTLKREARRTARLDLEALEAMRAALVPLAGRIGETPPTLRDCLGLPGIIEMVDEAGDTDERQVALETALLACARQCAEGLADARASEGRALQDVLSALVDAIAGETEALAALPEASGQHLMARLRAQLGRLLEPGAEIDPQRLYQEVALLATKADIAEELARLEAHVAAARVLLASDEPVGRRLDFLAQEFNREANTICSKASAIEVTQKGLSLKALIDQFKEQVQNVE